MVYRGQYYELIIILCCVAFLAIPQPARACMCNYLESAQARFAYVKQSGITAFLGDVTASVIEHETVCSSDNRHCREEKYDRVQFELVEAFGAISDPSMTIHVDRGNSCYTRLKPRQRYLVVASKYNEKWHTTLCEARLVDASRDDYEDRLADLAYLRSIQHQLSNPWLARIDSDHQFARDFLSHQISQGNRDHHGISHEVNVRATLWHDLDQDGEDDLIAHFTVGQLVDPGKVGPWIRQERHGVTVFLNKGDVLEDLPPTLAGLVF